MKGASYKVCSARFTQMCETAKSWLLPCHWLLSITTALQKEPCEPKKDYCNAQQKWRQNIFPKWPEKTTESKTTTTPSLVRQSQQEKGNDRNKKQKTAVRKTRVNIRLTIVTKEGSRRQEEIKMRGAKTPFYLTQHILCLSVFYITTIYTLNLFTHNCKPLFF